MREKLKSGLQRLSEYFTNVKATVHRGCNAGWNRFCKIVYGGICRLSNLLRKGYRGICEGCAALRDSKFCTAVKSFFTGLSHSRPIKALRIKMAQNNASIPKEDKPDSTPQQTAKRSVVDLVENGEITTEALEKELRRERWTSEKYGLRADCHRGSRCIDCNASASGAADIRQLHDADSSRGRHCGVCQNKDL